MVFSNQPGAGYRAGVLLWTAFSSRLAVGCFAAPVESVFYTLAPQLAAMFASYWLLRGRHLVLGHVYGHRADSIVILAASLMPFYFLGLWKDHRIHMYVVLFLILTVATIAMNWHENVGAKRIPQ